MNFKLLVLLSAAFQSAIFSVANHYSQAYIQSRPCYSNLYALTEFWNELAFEKNSCKNSNFQIIMFYQKSPDNPNNKRSQKLSEYFLMKNKSTLSVVGDSLPTQIKLSRDIRAEWLGLPSDFQGNFTLFPTQQQVGYMMEFKQDFKDVTKTDSHLANFWFGAALYLSSIENNLNLRQQVPPDSTKTIIGQLNRPELIYGKFTPGKHQSMGISELRLKVGTNFAAANDLQIAITSFVLIPCTNKQNTAHVFSPLRGFNGHPGLGSTVGFQFPLNKRCASYQFLFFANGENIFFIKGKEDRVLDLRQKPWSRFLLLNKNDGQTNIPAINVLTQRLEVHPHNFFDIAAGIKVRHNNFCASLSYGLWGHGSEKLKFTSRHQFPNLWGIAAPAGSPLTPEGIAPTASNSTIQQQAAVDMLDGHTIFEPITQENLDLKSGAARATLVQAAQASIGMIKSGKKCNVAFGVGAFIELPHNNSALEYFGFWAKIAASF